MKWLSRVRLFATPWTVASVHGFSVHGIFKARVLEWVTISFSRGSSQPRDQTQVSRIVGRHSYHLSHQGNQLVFLCNWAIIPRYVSALDLNTHFSSFLMAGSGWRQLGWVESQGPLPPNFPASSPNLPKPVQQGLANSSLWAVSAHHLAFGQPVG